MNSEYSDAVMDARAKVSEAEHGEFPGDVIVDSKNLTLASHGGGFFTAALY